MGLKPTLIQCGFALMQQIVTTKAVSSKGHSEGVGIHVNRTPLSPVLTPQEIIV